MRRLATVAHPNHLFYAITTQEEVGLRGAHAAAEVIKADLGIARERGNTRDVFPGHAEETQSRLSPAPIDTNPTPRDPVSSLITVHSCPIKNWSP